MNILKSRTVLGTLCIVVSLVICFLVAPFFNAAASSTVDVVRVKSNIAVGDKLTADNIEIVQVGSANLPETFNKLDLTVGKYAAYEMFAGELLMPQKVSDSPANENIYLYELNGENQAISITLSDFAVGLSGKLMPGDIVSIIAPNFRESEETVVPDELRFVEVIAVTDRSGYDLNKNSYSEEKTNLEPDGSEERELPSTVTLLVREEQAKLLAELESGGSFHISLVFRGNKVKANEFLKMQDEVINSLENKEENETGEDSESTE